MQIRVESVADPTGAAAAVAVLGVGGRGITSAVWSPAVWAGSWDGVGALLDLDDPTVSGELWLWVEGFAPVAVVAVECHGSLR